MHIGGDLGLLSSQATAVGPEALSLFLCGWAWHGCGIPNLKSLELQLTM